MISLAKCERRKVYRLESRHLSAGVFIGCGEAGFVGIRTKGGNRFLFIEDHCDVENGTAIPMEEIGEISRAVPLSAAEWNQELFDLLEAK